LRIKIFYDEIDFRVKNWKKVKKLIEKVILEKEKIPGDLNFILTNDRTLKDINKTFLKHNYKTDVISFDYGNDDFVSNEIYISIERVKANAKNYKVSYDNELLRVMIHGALHLTGYNDQNEREKDGMKRLEEKWLKIYEVI
jgi:probable rRNA maturation factor